MTEKEFEQCMDGMIQNDKDALKRVYEAYLPYIYGIVLGIVGGKELAEDVTSEFFIKLWDISDSYKKGKGHRGWMATIARNLAIDSLRKRKREVLTTFDSQSLEEETSKDADCQLDVEQDVLVNLSIKEALAQLSEKEKQVVHLKIMGELSFKEISSLLEEPMGTVTWRYQNAIKKLRRSGYE